MAEEARPEAGLSVVVATTKPWPEVRVCLESFLGEARAIGAEVVVPDSNGCGLPADAEVRYPDVVRLTEHGASIYRLRALGMARARGEVVAFLEDHCRAWPGWCAGHLSAHRDHPEVVGVGGRVENGARRRISDWASFLVNHAGWMAPVESGHRTSADYANVSFKRSRVVHEPSKDATEEAGRLRELRERGEPLFFDARIVADHDQSLGLIATLVLHFHAGRATAGLHVRAGLGPAARIRGVAGSLAVAPVFFVRTLMALHARRTTRPKVLASLPLEVVMLCVGSAGLFSGYLAGPGASPWRIP